MKDDGYGNRNKILRTCFHGLHKGIVSSFVKYPVTSVKSWFKNIMNVHNCLWTLLYYWWTITSE